MTEDRSRRGLLAAGAAALTGALAGCSLLGEGDSAGDGGGTVTAAPVPTVETETPGDPEPVGTELTVAHWNQQPDRRAGFEALVEGFQAFRPDVRVRPPEAGTLPLTPDGIERRVQRGFPPSVWQSEPGGKLRGLVRAGVLFDLEADIWSETAVRTAYPRALEVAGRQLGSHVAVPWYVERLNNLFYNPAVLDRAGVDVASLGGPAALVDALETIESTTDATPLAIGTGRPWGIGHLFEAVLAARNGPNRIDQLGEGNLDPETDAAIAEALETVATLSRFLPDDAEDIGRLTATERVIEGRAAVTIAPDSVVGGPGSNRGFGASDAVRGTDWDHAPFPGTRGIFQFTAQSFVGPRNNPTPETTRQWLRYCASAEAQRRFCAAAGAVPARIDVDPDTLPAFARRQYRTYRQAPDRFPSVTRGLVLPPERHVEYLSALFEFAEDWDAAATSERLLDVFSETD